MSNSNFNTIIIKIDSSKATHYTNSFHTAFNFNIDQPIGIHPGQSIVYNLVSAFIPYSFYSLNDYNCYLDVSQTIGTVTTTRTILIPSGNYSSTDFARLLMSLLNTDSIRYQIHYNKDSNTFSISTSAVPPVTTTPENTTLITTTPESITPVITTPVITAPVTASAYFLFGTGPHKAKRCYKFLGMTQDDILINAEPLTTGLITMNDCYYIQVISDMGDSTNYITADDSNHILEIIPVSDQPLNFISYYPFTPTKFLLHNTSLNHINIALLDNYNREIDLNGIPYQLTIRIDIIENEEYYIATGKGRESDVEPPQPTNLEFIMSNHNMINPATNMEPLNLSDMIEYRLIQQQLRKLKLKGKKNK